MYANLPSPVVQILNNGFGKIDDVQLSPEMVWRCYAAIFKFLGRLPENEGKNFNRR